MDMFDLREAGDTGGEDPSESRCDAPDNDDELLVTDAGDGGELGDDGRRAWLTATSGGV